MLVSWGGPKQRMGVQGQHRRGAPELDGGCLMGVTSIEGTPLEETPIEGRGPQAVVLLRGGHAGATQGLGALGAGGTGCGERGGRGGEGRAISGRNNNPAPGPSSPPPRGLVAVPSPGSPRHVQPRCAQGESWGTAPPWGSRGGPGCRCGHGSRPSISQSRVGCCALPGADRVVLGGLWGVAGGHQGPVPTMPWGFPVSPRQCPHLNSDGHVPVVLPVPPQGCPLVVLARGWQWGTPRFPPRAVGVPSAPPSPPFLTSHGGAAAASPIARFPHVMLAGLSSATWGVAPDAPTGTAGASPLAASCPGVPCSGFLPVGFGAV